MKPLIIVSGYPRTGTSLMMRILAFGGIKPLADPERVEKPTNAIGNPYGDYEFRNITKSMKKLGPKKTAGKSVKIVAPFIRDVPLDNRPKKVIFMKRDFSEIIASMLALKLIMQTGPDVAVPLALNFLRENDIPTLIVDFHVLRNYPKSIIAGIKEFVGLPFDEEEARKAIDLNSRRGRKKAKSDRDLLYFEGEIARMDVRRK